MKTQKIDRILGAIAVLSIIVAGFIGARLSEGDIASSLRESFPEADRFEPQNGGSVYQAIQSDTNEVLGYVAISAANGYGGPMKVAVAVDLVGNIHGLSIIAAKETSSWMQKVLETDFVHSLLGKNFSDSFQLGLDVDGVTGATYTSRAIAEAALNGSQFVAENHLGLAIPDTKLPEIEFGLKEITLIGLFTIGYFGHQGNFKYKKQVRWASMLIGMLVLGFLYTRPLTLSDVNKILLGYWPTWQTNLYWYLLIGGMLFVFTVDNKNPYCEWFCPFGAAQECLGAVGGAKSRSAGRFKRLLVWIQRGLAWLAIVLALLFRNPGITSYEIFGTLFDLIGSVWQFALLGIILIASLFIRRPWCTYLCPIGPVTDLYRTLRKWILELWKNRRKKAV